MLSFILKYSFPPPLFFHLSPRIFENEHLHFLRSSRRKEKNITGGQRGEENMIWRIWREHVPGYFSVTFFSRNCLYTTLLVSSSQFIASYSINWSRNSSCILKTHESCSKWYSSTGCVHKSMKNSFSSNTWHLVWCAGGWYTPPAHSACVSSLNKQWWWQHSDSDLHDWKQEAVKPITKAKLMTFFFFLNHFLQ